MSAEPLNRAAVEAEIAATAADVAAGDEPDEPGHDLGIPGAETVLLVIAGNVVVPILTGLLGKAAGAKYRELRTRRDINAAVPNSVRWPSYRHRQTRSIWRRCTAK